MRFHRLYYWTNLHSGVLGPGRNTEAGKLISDRYISQLEKEEEDLKILLRQTEPDTEQPNANIGAPDQVLEDAAEKTDGMTPGRFEAGGIRYVATIFQPCSLALWLKAVLETIESK